MAEVQAREVYDLRQLGATSTVDAFGHADDHLRIIVMIAQMTDPDGETEEAQACTSARSSWLTRRSAFKELVAIRRPKVTLVDVDALDVGISQGDRWSDLEQRRQRQRMLADLLELAAQHSWPLVRPAPTPGVTEELSQLGIKTGGDIGRRNIDLQDLRLALGLSALPGELRPVAQWLLAEGVVSSQELSRLLEPEPDDARDLGARVVVSATYDRLRPSVRKTALDLASIREEVPFNGVLGPLSVRGGRSLDIPSRSVPRSHVASLLACGFLQRRTAGGVERIRMPRTVRSCLEGRAQIRDRRRRKAMHGLMVESNSTGVLSRHWHAVCAGDVDTRIHAANRGCQADPAV